MQKNKNAYFRLLAGLTLLWASICPAGTSVREILQKKNSVKEVFSMYVADADTGDCLFSHHAQQPMIPASTMKLIVSAAALHYLQLPSIVY